MRWSAPLKETFWIDNRQRKRRCWGQSLEVVGPFVGWWFKRLAVVLYAQSLAFSSHRVALLMPSFGDAPRISLLYLTTSIPVFPQKGRRREKVFRRGQRADPKYRSISLGKYLAFLFTTCRRLSSAVFHILTSLSSSSSYITRSLWWLFLVVSLIGGGRHNCVINQ